MVLLLSVLCSNFVHNAYFEKLVFTAFKRKFITVTVRADDLQNLLRYSIILISKIKPASIRSRDLFTKLLHRLLRNSQQTSRSFLPKSFWGRVKFSSCLGLAPSQSLSPSLTPPPEGNSDHVTFRFDVSLCLTAW